MCCDVSPRGKFVASGGWDRTVRLFGSEDYEIKEEVEVKMEVDG
jgi:WD40 repeat protein